MRIQLAGADLLQLAEVKIMGDPDVEQRSPVNLALGQFAQQSSTGYNGHAWKAVDGDTDGYYHRSMSVTHTGRNNQAWWEVDLGNTHRLDHVELWNRTDCCASRLKNFYVLISERPFDSQDLTATMAQSGVRSFHFPGTAEELTTLDLGAVGRYVRIQLAGQDYLQLAEVKVMGN